MTFGPHRSSVFMSRERLVMRSVHVWERPSERRIFTDVERSVKFLMRAWPQEFHGTAKHREALWQAELALKSDESSEFRIAFIVAAAEAGILAPRDTSEAT